MNYELLKQKYQKIKKQELNYIDNIVKSSTNHILSEFEKLKIYRTLKNYQNELNKLLQELHHEIIQNKSLKNENINDIIIEFNIDKNYLSHLKVNYQSYKKLILKSLGINIETSMYQLPLSYIIHNSNKYNGIDIDLILNNQKLIKDPIYVFCEFYDSSEDCYGPTFGDSNTYLYGIYENISNRYYDKLEIPKKEINEFEKDKIIISSKKYVKSFEIKKIFEEELLNNKNHTINDCVIQTRKRIEELDYLRSPEYKEKLLLEKINNLYQLVSGKLIKEEILYSGNFLQTLKETYLLPNKKIVSKEKIIKNNGKDSVIIIAITQNNQYIITIQNRIRNTLIAEFPSGYIEDFETPLEAAYRELQEETGYISNDLFLIDEAYTSPGTDNSKTYIIIANHCIETNKIANKGTELVEYGLFEELELVYLINHNIMNGAMNKLAYYNLINNKNFIKNKRKTLY